MESDGIVLEDDAPPAQAFPRSIHKIAERRVLYDMIDGVTKGKGDGAARWCVLVVDEMGKKVISSVTDMKELTNHNISIVEDLNKGRMPFPGLDVIYLVDPMCPDCDDSIEMICKDFDPSPLDPNAKPLYGQVHIFFLTHVTDDMLQPLVNSNVDDRIKTCKELNLSYTPIDAHAFTMAHQFDSTCANKFYGQGAQERGESGMESLLLHTMTGLFTFLTSVGEKPKYIRYLDSRSPNSMLAREMASMIKKELDELVGNGPEQVRLNTDNETTLLIVDRSFDVQTMLMDHFHYGALVMDKPEIQGKISGKFNANIKVEIEKCESFGMVHSTIGDESPKTHYLNEDNAAWQALRFHVPPAAGSCFKQLREGLDVQYSAASKVQKMLKDKNFDKKNMSDADARIYKKGVKEFMPFKDKRDAIDNMTHMFLLTSDPKNNEVQQKKNRREDLMQFQQHVAIKSKDCFQGGDEDQSERISVETKLLNILKGPKFTKEEKEQNLLLYYATYGMEGKKSSIMRGCEVCDRDFNTSCIFLMGQLDKILGADFAQAAPPDPSRMTLYANAMKHVTAQIPEHEDYREAKKAVKSSPVPTVKVNGEEMIDYTGLAAVHKIMWPPMKKEVELDWIQQCTFFNSWRPRLYDVCDKILQGKMDEIECPFTAGQNAAPKHRRGASMGQGGWGNSLRGGSNKVTSESTAPGLIVFVIGGICHEEIQVIYELLNKHKKDVYLGSTHMSNPEFFVQKGLKGMSAGGGYGSFGASGPGASGYNSTQHQPQPSVVDTNPF